MRAATGTKGVRAGGRWGRVAHETGSGGAQTLAAMSLHPLRVRGSQRNERARRRGDGRQKHVSGDDFLFPRGSTGNGLTRHGSFSVQGVSKRQRGMEVGAAPTGLALPVDEAGILAVLRHPKEPLVSIALFTSCVILGTPGISILRLVGMGKVLLLLVIFLDWFL